MSFGEFLGLAVVVGGICAIFSMMVEAYKSKMRVKERELELRLAQMGQTEARSPAQPDRIEERLRVLERIATDKTADLATQIEDLRKETVNS